MPLKAGDSSRGQHELATMVSELSVKNCIESNSIFNSKKEKKAHKKPKPRKKVCKFKGIACKDGENLSECLCHRGCSAIDSHVAFLFL